MGHTQADVAVWRERAPDRHARSGCPPPVLVPPDAAEVHGSALRAALRHRAQQLGAAVLELPVVPVALWPLRQGFGCLPGSRRCRACTGSWS